MPFLGSKNKPIDLTVDYGNCLICLEELLPVLMKGKATVTVNDCNHKCHEECFYKWMNLERNNHRVTRCILCRRAITQINIKVNY